MTSLRLWIVPLLVLSPAIAQARPAPRQVLLDERMRQVVTSALDRIRRDEGRMAAPGVSRSDDAMADLRQTVLDRLSIAADLTRPL